MRNPFKKKLQLPPTINMEVRLINDEGSTGEVLGITRERFEVLAKAMTEAYVVGELPWQTIAKASKTATHPNELAFMCFSLGGVYERNNNPLGALFAMLGDHE